MDVMYLKLKDSTFYAFGVKLLDFTDFHCIVFSRNWALSLFNVAYTLLRASTISELVVHFESAPAPWSRAPL